jgi:hypothetical protein
MDATELFLRDHARVHSKGVGDAEGGMFLENFLLDGLTDEQMRLRPAEGTNSLVWIFWHMARSEDMGINVIVAGRPQVIEEDNWIERLGLSRADIGTGMTDDDVSDFSARVDIATMRAYRAAVGKRTREVVSALRPEEWAEIQDADSMQRVDAAGALGPNAGWIPTVFGGKSNALILSHTGVGHNFWHLGEAMTVRSLAGLRLPT